MDLKAIQNRGLREVGEPTLGVADALLSATQRRILRLLLAHTGQSLFTTQIIDLVAAGRGGVQRELKRLVQCGLLQQSQQAHQKHYRFNELHPSAAAVAQLLGFATVVPPSLQQLLRGLRFSCRLIALCPPEPKVDPGCTGTGTYRGYLAGIVSDRFDRGQICADFEPWPELNLQVVSTAQFIRGLRRNDRMMVRIATGPHELALAGTAWCSTGTQTRRPHIDNSHTLF